VKQILVLEEDSNPTVAAACNLGYIEVEHALQNTFTEAGLDALTEVTAEPKDEFVLSTSPARFFCLLVIEFLIAWGSVCLFLVSLPVFEVAESIYKGLLCVAVYAALPLRWAWRCSRYPVSISSQAISGPSFDLKNWEVSRITIPLSSIDTQLTELDTRWWLRGSWNFLRIVDSEKREIRIYLEMYSAGDIRRMLDILRNFQPTMKAH
jgi:hypothetical protein